ncbi:hypothetical protein Tco_1109176 [Tanacetum coccineum]
MKNAHINEDHFCSDGCTGSGEARVHQRKRRIQRRVQQKQKDQEDEVFGRILSAKKMKVYFQKLNDLKTIEELTTAGYRVATTGSRLLLLSRFRILFDIHTKFLPLLFWIHPRRNKQEELFTHKEEMAPMALSDSKVNNDKSCSKTCLTNYEALKKQYDDLLVKLDDTGFKAATYKRGYKEYQMRLLRDELEKVKQEKEGFEFKIAKFEKSAKDLDQLLGSQITDNSKKGLGYSAVPPPHPLILNRPTPLDLSYSGLDEFKEPEFKGYGPENSKKESNVVCENSSNETKKNYDAPIIEEWVSDNEDEVESPVVVKKKTVIPTAAKIEKPVRKPVRYAEMYRSQRPRGNQRNWNGQKSNQLGCNFVFNNKACFICGSFDHIQYSCPNQQRKRIVSGNNYNKKDNDYYSKTSHSSAHKHMAPRAVLMKTGLKSFNTVRPSAC